MPWGVSSQRTQLARGAGALTVGRFAGGVGGERAAALHHDAEAAEAEDLDLHRSAGDDALHLGQGQDPRQDGALDAEALVIIVDRLVAGRRALDREMQAQPRMPFGGVVHEAGIGEDDGIDAKLRGAVHRPVQLGQLPAWG
jgi:hypothetical protein